MKNLFTSLIFLSCTFAFAQGYLQTHVIKVTNGNDVPAFIEAQKNVYSKLATLAVKEGKMGGWSAHQGVNKPNTFVFLHFFNSLEQRAAYDGYSVWNSENLKKLGLEAPATIATTSDDPLVTYYVPTWVGTDGEIANYHMINHHKYIDGVTYTKSQMTWKDYISKATANGMAKSKTWAFGYVISFGGEAVDTNGISFDGYESLTDLFMDRQNMADPNFTPNPLLQKWSENWASNDYEENIKFLESYTVKTIASAL